MRFAAILSDLLLVVGAGGISYGVWCIDPHVGYIVGGSLLLTAGIMRGRAEAMARVVITGKDGSK